MTKEEFKVGWNEGRLHVILDDLDKTYMFFENIISDVSFNFNHAFKSINKKEEINSWKNHFALNQDSIECICSGGISTSSSGIKKENLIKLDKVLNILDPKRDINNNIKILQELLQTVTNKTN